MNPKIWYSDPARAWCDAFPLANGTLGTMHFGAPRADRFLLSETTFWSGEPSEVNDAPNGPRVIAEIRKALSAGRLDEAHALAGTIEGRKLDYGTNLPFGNLTIISDFPDIEASDYRRELDLADAVSTVTFRHGGRLYTREAFVSHPDGLLAVRLTCDTPKSVTVRISLDGHEQPYDARTDGDDTILMDVLALEPIHSDGRTGVSGHARLRISAEGGTVSAQRNLLAVDRADEVVILLAAGTGFSGEDPAFLCRKRIEKGMKKRFEVLKAAHSADHRSFFDRASLELAGGGEDLPYDARIAAFQRGAADPGLFALLFHFGRYLLIGSSRPDSPLPAHLIGAWNDNVACRIGWTCDYHLDINTQMNYWISEVTGVGECQMPLFRWMRERLIPSGRRTAERFYGCHGWVAHIVANAWGYSAPGWSTWWGFFPTGGVWTATHLWDRYAYSGDVAFLEKTCYPILKEAAEFFLEYLVDDPETGFLLTGPAISPETAYLRDGKRYPLSMGPTVDRILLHELFSDCIEAADTLGVDTEFTARLTAARSKLPPFRVGKHGQLMEWLADDEDALPHHRHTSHLLALFPFAQITPHDTPDLARAARTSIERRLNAPGGFEEGAWARNNMTLFFARLGDAEAAYGSISTFIIKEADRSPMAGTKLAPGNAYEMDYNTGASAAIAEMLLQSHRGVVTLLPALPEAWPEGRIAGFRARGGFIVDISWSEGLLTEARITSLLGRPCRVRAGLPVEVTVNGRSVSAGEDADGVVAFGTEAECVYRIAPRR